jgi:hypothetical protein
VSERERKMAGKGTEKGHKTGSGNSRDKDRTGREVNERGREGRWGKGEEGGRGGGKGVPVVCPLSFAVKAFGAFQEEVKVERAELRERKEGREGGRERKEGREVGRGREGEEGGEGERGREG